MPDLRGVIGKEAICASRGGDASEKATRLGRGWGHKQLVANSPCKGYSGSDHHPGTKGVRKTTTLPKEPLEYTVELGAVAESAGGW